MAERPRFDPLFPAHAIERCAATVAFRENLPEKAFARLIAGINEAFARKGLKAAEPPQLAFNIDFGSVKFTGPPPSTQPRMFALPDGSANLFIAPNHVIWQNTRYVRWAPFVGQFLDLARSTIAGFLDSVSLASVRLEYWDRFNWTGTWDDFDVEQLIRREADAVARGWAKWPKQWHSHSGWFEKVEDFRRLINVNVDIGEWAGHPSVLIYTTIQDDPNVPGYGQTDPDSLDENFVFGRFEAIHYDLKDQLAEVIQDAMVSRISLKGEEVAP
jgi:hypothetical protein